MLLFPRQIKNKKIHRKQLKKTSRLRSVFTYKKNSIRIITTQSSLISSKQLEAVRTYLSKKFKTISRFHNGIFPDLPVTAKPTAMRMGKGKGNFKKWICKIDSGTLLFFFKGLPYLTVKQNLLKKINKLKIHLKIKEC